MADKNEAVEEEQDDLRASLDAAFGPADDEAPQEADDATEAEEPVEEPAEDGAESDGADEKTEEAAEADGKDDKPDEIKAPATWSKEDKEAFYAMPIEAQKAVAKRERDRERHFSKRNEAIVQKEKQFSQLDGVLSPIRERLTQAGVSEAEYVSRLMNADRMLQEKPAEAIMQLAQSAGVDLRQLVGGQSGDDYTSHLEQQIRDAQAKIQSLEGAWNGFQQQTTQQRQAELNSQIEAFASETDEAGNPRYPHFEELRGDMALFLSNGKAETLRDAYDMAVYANPKTRSAIQEDHAARLAAKRKADTDRKKAASSSIAGSPSMGSNPEDAPETDIRASLEKAFDGRL